MVSLSWDGPSGPRAAARRPEMPSLPRNTIGKSTTGLTGPKPDQVYVYIYIYISVAYLRVENDGIDECLTAPVQQRRQVFFHDAKSVSADLAVHLEPGRRST